MSVLVRLAPGPLDPQAELAAFAAAHQGGAAGALASFVGLCRAEGARVTELFLDHYPGFTEAELARIGEAAAARFDLIGALVAHRCGGVAAGAPIVVAAALARHRKPALHAVDFLMDHLKTDAPFWKREIGPAGARWIEPARADQDARAQWDRTR